jgi:hypothetical protein
VDGCQRIYGELIGSDVPGICQQDGGGGDAEESPQPLGTVQKGGGEPADEGKEDHLLRTALAKAA